MSQSFTKVFSKMLTVIFVLSLVATSLPVNAAESKNSIDDLKKIQNNIREKDPFKIKSQNLNKISNNILVSSQKLNNEDLNLEIDSNLKKLSIKHSKKGITKIGFPESEKLTDIQTIDNQVIFSNKNTKFDIIVEAVDGGIRQFINIKDSSAPTFYDFPIELLPGENIIINEDGSARIESSELYENSNLPVTKVLIGKPWAKDNKGKDLETSYVLVSNNVLRQKINLSNASFPITADPIFCGDAIQNVSWLNKGAGVWSASNNPTSCGAWNCNGGNNNSCWNESYSKTSTCAQYSGSQCVNQPWNKQIGTNQYWSMYNQFICHADFAKGFKTPWNIEPATPDKGYWGFANFWDKCN